MTEFIFRKPTAQDAAAIHAMMQPYKPYVGTNPIYTYLLICEHFCDTSIVATTTDGKIVGFVSGYMPPAKSDTLFIWEIAVKEGFHGNRLYLRMVQEICTSIQPRYLEATVNPSNASSIKRLEQLADIFSCGVSEAPLFPAAYFGKQAHEDEVLYRIGALKNARDFEKNT